MPIERASYCTSEATERNALTVTYLQDPSITHEAIAMEMEAWPNNGPGISLMRRFLRQPNPAVLRLRPELKKRGVRINKLAKLAEHVNELPEPTRVAIVTQETPNHTLTYYLVHHLQIDRVAQIAKAFTASRAPSAGVESRS